MRKIESHKVSNNDKLEITVTDEPGAGGANHRYEVTGFDTGSNPSDDKPFGFRRMIILFQNGPIPENGVNGITQEVLLAIVKDRLECFQAHAFACEENEEALKLVNGALAWLQTRTARRINRGVEGKSEK